MSPIKPGTLCLIVQADPPSVPAEYVGTTCTMIRAEQWHCEQCGALGYTVKLQGDPEGACRAILRPILPPGVDVTETHDEILPEPVV